MKIEVNLNFESEIFSKMKNLDCFSTPLDSLKFYFLKNFQEILEF